MSFINFFTKIFDKENRKMSEKKNNLDLSAPWYTYFTEIKMLFEKDPAVSVKFDSENYVISIYVDGTEKAYALSQLLPAVKDLGVPVRIRVIPSNVPYESDFELLKRAFKDNPVLVDAIEATNGHHYIVFKKEVVQFFNDQLDDVHGYKSTLFQHIAKEVFDSIDPSVHFCTEIKNE